MTDRERAALRANILGRLAANLVLATGAWQGVMMHGRRLPDFGADTREAFDAGFSRQTSFRRLIGAARCWRVEQREPVLAGAAALLMQRHRHRGG